jgi:hypothetical protein
MSITRRQILAAAAGTAAVAAMPAAAVGAVEVAPFDLDRFLSFTAAETERLHPGTDAMMNRAVCKWPSAPFVDRQAFFDGKIDWTFYARRREWIGIDRIGIEDAS